MLRSCAVRLAPSCFFRACISPAALGNTTRSRAFVSLNHHVNIKRHIASSSSLKDLLPSKEKMDVQLYVYDLSRVKRTSILYLRLCD